MIGVDTMAEIKKIGDVKVNDGKGLLDNEGMCDSLVTDCNNLVKLITSGQYILFCNTIVQMVQKLANLQKGIKSDLQSKDKIIEELKRINNELVQEKTGLPVLDGRSEKDGGNNGE